MADVVKNILVLDSQYHHLIINNKGNVDFRLVAPFPDDLDKVTTITSTLEKAVRHIKKKNLNDKETLEYIQKFDDVERLNIWTYLANDHKTGYPYAKDELVIDLWGCPANTYSETTSISGDHITFETMRSPPSEAIAALSRKVPNCKMAIWSFYEYEHAVMTTYLAGNVLSEQDTEASIQSHLFTGLPYDYDMWRQAGKKLGLPIPEKRECIYLHHKFLQLGENIFHRKFGSTSDTLPHEKILKHIEDDIPLCDIEYFLDKGIMICPNGINSFWTELNIAVDPAALDDAFAGFDLTIEYVVPKLTLKNIIACSSQDLIDVYLPYFNALRFSKLVKEVGNCKTSSEVWEDIFYYLNAFNDKRNVSLDGYTMLKDAMSLQDVVAWADEQPDVDLSALPTYVRNRYVGLYRSMHELIKYVRLIDSPTHGDLYRTLYKLVLNETTN